jgi:hypothetical protein
MRDARLRECDYGRLTRGSIREIEAQRAAHITIPFPDGESYQQVWSPRWRAKNRVWFLGEGLLRHLPRPLYTCEAFLTEVAHFLGNV